MEQNYLPGVWDTMRGLMSNDNWNMFTKFFSLPNNEKRR